MLIQRMIFRVAALKMQTMAGIATRPVAATLHLQTHLPHKGSVPATATW